MVAIASAIVPVNPGGYMPTESIRPYGRYTERTYLEQPSFFLPEYELEDRFVIGRARVIEVIRFSARPLSGRGLCQEVHGLEDSVERFVDFIDSVDGRRARKNRSFKRSYDRGLQANQYAIRSPQSLSKRRSALFGGKDVPTGYLEEEYGLTSQAERDVFVELMRWRITYEVVLKMIASHELECMNGVWTLKTTALDKHRQQARRSSNRVKQDDRSFHGRPNRDRGTLVS